MKKLLRIGFLGLVTGIIGVMLVPLCPPLEEDAGLSLLFNLRGKRPVPPEVCMVRMDRASARALSIHEDPSLWPRSVHARLLSRLSAFHPAVIVFDIVFSEPRGEAEDAALEAALAASSNVVLCAMSDLEHMDIGQGRGAVVERVAPPQARFARQAAAAVPFPLPKIPLRVNHFWTFRDDAGQIPSLPLAAMLCYLRTSEEDAWRRCFAPSLTPADPAGGGDLVGPMAGLSANLRRKLQGAEPAASPAPEGRALSPLVRRVLDLHAARSDTQLLNFYGPQGTIPTVSYHRAIGGDPSAPGDDASLFAGKAVFVGLDDPDAPTRKDDFNTVFSQRDGRSLSGTEIAATAFANLLDGSSPRAAPRYASVLIALGFGILLGALCRALPTLLSALAALLAAAAYVAAAVGALSHSFLWLPVVVPGLILPLVAFVAALADRSAVAALERRRLHDAASLYLPETVVSRLAASARDIEGDQKVVHATCVITDATNYTPLSEAMDPRELGRFMNRYFETAFRPMREHGGLVMNLTGDSILAVWLAKSPEEGAAPKACRAALELVAGIREFNRKASAGALPTRIGIHYGPILLGSMGALDHFEYVPIGDTVNTAARLEALNKQLRTEILVSEEAARSATGFFTRSLGAFRFAGKNRPLEVFELMCVDEEANIALKRTRRKFEDGIGFLKDGAWQQAGALFQSVLDEKPDDGPARFFLELCGTYTTRPPVAWSGVVPVGKE